MIEQKRYCDICGSEMAIGRERDRWEITIEKLFRNGSKQTDFLDMCIHCRDSFYAWKKSRMPQADCSWMKAEK